MVTWIITEHQCFTVSCWSSIFSILTSDVTEMLITFTGAFYRFTQPKVTHCKNRKFLHVAFWQKMYYDINPEKVSYFNHFIYVYTCNQHGMIPGTLSISSVPQTYNINVIHISVILMKKTICYINIYISNVLPYNPRIHFVIDLLHVLNISKIILKSKSFLYQTNDKKKLCC